MEELATVDPSLLMHPAYNAAPANSGALIAPTQPRPRKNRRWPDDESEALRELVGTCRNSLGQTAWAPVLEQLTQRYPPPPTFPPRTKRQLQTHWAQMNINGEPRKRRRDTTSTPAAAPNAVDDNRPPKKTRVYFEAPFTPTEDEELLGLNRLWTGQYKRIGRAMEPQRRKQDVRERLDQLLSLSPSSAPSTSPVLAQFQPRQDAPVDVKSLYKNLRTQYGRRRCPKITFVLELCSASPLSRQEGEQTGIVNPIPATNRRATPPPSTPPSESGGSRSPRAAVAFTSPPPTHFPSPSLNSASPTPPPPSPRPSRNIKLRVFFDEEQHNSQQPTRPGSTRWLPSHTSNLSRAVDAASTLVQSSCLSSDEWDSLGRELEPARAGPACRRQWFKMQAESSGRDGFAGEEDEEEEDSEEEEEDGLFTPEEDAELLRLNDAAPWGQYRTIAGSLSQPRDWRYVRRRLDQLYVFDLSLPAARSPNFRHCSLSVRSKLDSTPLRIRLSAPSPSLKRRLSQSVSPSPAAVDLNSFKPRKRNGNGWLWIPEEDAVLEQMQGLPPSEWPGWEEVALALAEEEPMPDYASPRTAAHCMGRWRFLETRRLDEARATSVQKSVHASASLASPPSRAPSPPITPAAKFTFCSNSHLSLLSSTLTPLRQYSAHSPAPALRTPTQASLIRSQVDSAPARNVDVVKGLASGERERRGTLEEALEGLAAFLEPWED